MLPSTLQFLAALVAYLVVWILPAAVFVGVVYYLLSLPLRRQERARFFLDLVEAGLKAGQSVERTLVGIAQSRDTSVGARFHLVAAYLASGHRLVGALEKVPSLLPAQIVAALKAGQEIGDIGKVLPGCRKMLREGGGRFRAAINYQILLLFTFNPLVILAMPLFYAATVPEAAKVLGYFGQKPPLFLRLVLSSADFFYSAQWFVVVALVAGAAFYISGPRLINWLEAGLYPVSHWLACLMPWRRKRLQRDFTTMLALLLDAEVPEDRALTLAAQSTANRLFIKRAEKVARALQQGQPLTEAVAAIDDSGELRWRLTNAIHAQRGFVQALGGWQEALDAKAFQQEQAAAQFLSTVLVILNGITVAAIAAAVLQSIGALTAFQCRD